MTDKIIEAMARALCCGGRSCEAHERNRTNEGHGYLVDCDMVSHTKLARAALTAFMDATREPSYDVIMAQYGISATIRNTPSKALSVGKATYQAMHDKLREEVLGDD